jgi:hypothetical protein
MTPVQTALAHDLRIRLTELRARGAGIPVPHLRLLDPPPPAPDHPLTRQEILASVLGRPTNDPGRGVVRLHHLLVWALVRGYVEIWDLLAFKPTFDRCPKSLLRGLSPEEQASLINGLKPGVLRAEVAVRHQAVVDQAVAEWQARRDSLLRLLGVDLAHAHAKEQAFLAKRRRPPKSEAQAFALVSSMLATTPGLSASVRSLRFAKSAILAVEKEHRAAFERGELVTARDYFTRALDEAFFWLSVQPTDP